MLRPIVDLPVRARIPVSFMDSRERLWYIEHPDYKTPDQLQRERFGIYSKPMYQSPQYYLPYPGYQPSWIVRVLQRIFSSIRWCIGLFRRWWYTPGPLPKRYDWFQEKWRSDIRVKLPRRLMTEKEKATTIGRYLLTWCSSCH